MDSELGKFSSAPRDFTISVSLCWALGAGMHSGEAVTGMSLTCCPVLYPHREWMRKKKLKLCSGRSPMPCRRSLCRPSLCRYSQRGWTGGHSRNAVLAASQWQECGGSLPGQGPQPMQERQGGQGGWALGGRAAETERGPGCPCCCVCPESPGCTCWAGAGSKEGSQHLALASGLSPGSLPISPRIRELQASTTARRTLRGWLLALPGHSEPWRPGWERRSSKKLPPWPEQELVLEQGPGWPKKGFGGSSGSFHLKGDTSFCPFSLQEIPRAFQFIKIVIHSNWGNPEYTCIYWVQVHGRGTATSHWPEDMSSADKNKK